MARMLKPRDFVSILSDTFSIYWRNMLGLLVIVAIVEVVLGVLSYVVLPVTTTGGWSGYMSPLYPGSIQYIAPFILLNIILFVGYIVAYPLMEGALIHAISEQHFQQPVGIGRAYRFAWRRIVALVGASIIATLALLLMVLTIIGIPFAIYFGVRWAFILQAALLEGFGPRAALSRSSDLVRGTWWRVLGIMLVVIIITAAISAIFGTIPVVGVIIGSILSIPVAAIGSTLLYYDLRVRKEGYTLEELAGELHIKADSDVA